MTGSAGFLGRTLVRTLLAAGESVVGVDSAGHPGRSGQPGLTVLRADLLSGDERVRAALRSADAVFHLAGCPGVRDRRPDAPLRRWRDNVLATAVVLEEVPPQVPLVVTSSSSVYGGASGGRPSAETDPLRPRGGYAASKVRAEELCAARLDAGGTVAVARPFTVAGEGQRLDMALAQWIAAARAGRALRLLGSPERTRDITDVVEVARVLVALAQREVAGVVNVGTGVGHRLQDLVDAVASVLGVEVRTVVEPVEAVEPADTLADTRRLRHTVGFVPRTDLRALVGRQAACPAEPAALAS